MIAKNTKNQRKRLLEQNNANFKIYKTLNDHSHFLKVKEGYLISPLPQ